MSYGHRPKSNFCATLLFLWIAVSARIIALVLQLYEQNKLKLKLSETVQQQIRSKLITKICYTLSVIKILHVTSLPQGEPVPERKKNNVDFTEAKDNEWHWHQLGHMQVCTSLQTDNHASTPPLLLQTGCPSCRPTNSVKAQKAYSLCRNTEM